MMAAAAGEAEELGVVAAAVVQADVGVWIVWMCTITGNTLTPPLTMAGAAAEVEVEVVVAAAGAAAAGAAAAAAAEAAEVEAVGAG